MSRLDERPASVRWLRPLQAAHLAGIILFLGGIGAAIVLGAARHLGDLDAFRARRAIAADLTGALIVPGMWLTVASGAALAWRMRGGLFRWSWLGAKQVAGLAILVNGTVMLVPLVRRISELMTDLGPDLVEAARLQHREDVLGGVNLLLGLLSLVLAVWRPRPGEGARALQHQARSSQARVATASLARLDGSAAQREGEAGSPTPSQSPPVSRPGSSSTASHT